MLNADSAAPAAVLHCFVMLVLSVTISVSGCIVDCPCGRAGTDKFVYDAKDWFRAGPTMSPAQDNDTENKRT